ncbi:MAG: hypothetical protein ACRDCJ_02545 [Metamycoplasmataceae bacterium]
MKMYDIFIDFECISGMFARKVNKSFNQIPLSYTIGYRNKKNEIITIFEIFDFDQKNLPLNNNLVIFIIDDFYKSLTINIKKLIKKRGPLDIGEINFIGWNPSLEKQLLEAIFRRPVTVNSLVRNCFDDETVSLKRDISLSKVTKKGFIRKQYFPKFRNEISNILTTEEIRKYNLNHDGALASYAGFVLYNIIKKTRKTKYHIYMNLKILQDELKDYALDDINRMYYFVDNLSEIKTIIKKLKIVDDLKKDINNNTRLLILLSEYNPNIRVKDLIKKLEKENFEANKKIPLFEE